MPLKIIIDADDDLKRMRGLMFHRPITAQECAFFTFPRTGQHCFWNQNVSFPIDVVFCDKNGVVRDIKRLEAGQREIVKPSTFEVKYVVETNDKAATIHGISVGAKMRRDGAEVRFE